MSTRRDAAASSGPARGLAIGEVVAELSAQFPGVTASKVRFLEEQGLVTPERTAAGYRRFRAADVARLRFVLAAQRESFLPLKVIREQLDALDRGERLEDPPGGPELARLAAATGLRPGPEGTPRRWSRAELARESGAGEELLAELEQYSLLPVAADGAYPAEAMAVARAALTLAGHGLEPRHLRPFRAAADRELGLVERVVAPLAGRRDAGTRDRVAAASREIAQACQRLHGALVEDGLRRQTGTEAPA